MVCTSRMKAVIVGGGACVYCVWGVVSSWSELCIVCRVRMRYFSERVGCFMRTLFIVVCGVFCIVKWGWHICVASALRRCGLDARARSRRVACCAVWLNAWHCWQ